MFLITHPVTRMRPTFYQRAKEVMTKPITLKGTAAFLRKIFRRKSLREDIITTSTLERIKNPSCDPEPRKNSVDSGLWEGDTVGIRSKSVIKKANSFRNKALSLTAEGHEEYADGFNMEAANLYIQAGLLSKAEQIGLEFQERGRYLTAAKILSQSGAIPFFQLVESLHKFGLDKMARKILRDFTGPRGIVKYQEMEK